MKKKIAVIVTVFLVTPFLLAAILYIALSIYYSNSFMFGVFINGVYATGKTPDEINAKLMEQSQADVFTIKDKYGETTQIKLSDIGYTHSYLEPIKELQKKQNPFLWIKTLEGYEDYSIKPQGAFDSSMFDKVFENLEIIKTASDKSKLVVEIHKGVSGYELIDTTTNLINKEKSRECIEQALYEGEYNVDLLESGCYEEFDYTGQMKETIELYKKIEDFTSAEIIYQFDTQEVVVDRKVTSDWIVLDESGEFVFDEFGNLTLDETAVTEYVEGLARQFDTVDHDRQFVATRGEIVTVPAGTYGNKLNQEEEVAYLTQAFLDHKKEEHEPIYSQRAWGYGDNDIGDTYIEVDLTNQKLYYYRGGKQVISTDVVTGNISKRNGTPAKACYVYFMQRDRVLRGEDYATPVDYWMAVYGNIGIHDATWRGKFGGTIYRTNGSHGCINTPYKEVSKLYEMVEIGTPVMIFY